MNISVDWHWCNAVHQHIAHIVALPKKIILCRHLYLLLPICQILLMTLYTDGARCKKLWRTSLIVTIWQFENLKMWKFENLSEWGFLPLSCAGRDSLGLKCTLGGEGVVWAEGGNEGGGLTSHYVRLVRRRRRRRRRRCKSGKIFIVRLSRPKI